MRDIEVTVLEIDEFEALRLCDAEGLDQTAAGERMGVSRGTVQRLLATARGKLVTAILDRDAIVMNLTQKEVDHAGLHPHQARNRPRRRGV